jgi:hypothetical protein
VRYEGPTTVYARTADSGLTVRYYFCPTCGTTVYWEADKYPDQCGTAAGCFADPTFPAPVMSMWEESKHPWLTLPASIVDHLELGLGADGRPMKR